MDAIFTKISAFFMSIITAVSLLPINIINAITSDTGFIEKISYSKYNDSAEKFCEIPALDTQFVPQGLAYSEYLDKILVCGYMNEDNKASRIYVINPESGVNEKYVTLTEVDGDIYTGHCGGIATFEKNAWVVSGKYARRLPLDLLKTAENESNVQFVDEFNSGTRASYANVSNGILWVGEYHKNGETYATDESHHMTSPNGEKMCAWTCGYILESGSETGFVYDGKSKEVVTPDYILATESMCQGFMQLSDGRFVTSISGSLVKSELNTFENVLNNEADATVTISGKEIKLWFLDSETKVTSLNALPRSEGIDDYNGKTLVLYESGCKKMFASQLVRTENIWNVTL